MIVKFKKGAAGYGLGYLAGEVAELKDKVKVRQMTTLVDQQGNVKGQDWRDQVITLDQLIEDGICSPANAEETATFKAKSAEETKAAKAAKSAEETKAAKAAKSAEETKEAKEDAKAGK